MRLVSVARVDDLPLARCAEHLTVVFVHRWMGWFDECLLGKRVHDVLHLYDRPRVHK